MDLPIVLSDFDIRTRYLVNRYFAEYGCSPNLDELTKLQKCQSIEVKDSLLRLENDHRLLLYPHNHGIWVAHPFSAAPTNYWVEVGERGWWGNCAFCALGIAAMLGDETTIYTRLQAERSAIEIRATQSSIRPSDLYLHIPLPVSHWHDNVTFTCSNVHFFESPEAIDRWSERHSLPRGRDIQLSTAWNLAKRWYGEYLDPGWRPLDNAKSNALFREFDLTGPFWRLPDE